MGNKLIKKFIGFIIAIFIIGLNLNLMKIAKAAALNNEQTNLLSSVEKITNSHVEILNLVKKIFYGQPESNLKAEIINVDKVQDILQTIQSQLNELKSIISGLKTTDQNIPDYKLGELILKFKEGISNQDQATALKAYGLQIKKEIKQIKTKIISVPEEAEEELIDVLSRNPKIEYAEKNFLGQGGLIPNDPKYASQWHLPKISAPAGWDLSTGNSQITLAVIDSGVDPAHPDLAGKLLPGYNYLNNNTDTHDVLGHGTAVAGTAAALSNNAIGVASLAWQNPVLPLVVLNSSNYASYSDIASAIIYAADNNAKVINISIGGSSYSSTLQNAVNYAWNKGAVIVACAMNNGNDVKMYPAALTNVIAVSATDSSDKLASFSNYGNWIDLSAPGANIFTTTNGGGYGAWNGTSFSSPIVAGLTSLIFSAKPSLTNTQAINLIEQNSDDLGAAGYDIYFGYGRVNIYKALQAALGTTTPSDNISPTASITSPLANSTVSGLVDIAVSASDNVEVSKVELYKDGVLYATDNSSPYSYSWDTTSDANGSHTLQAKAYDAANNTGLSESITVNVNNAADTIPPTVNITKPSNGAPLPSKGTQAISAAASDNKGVTEINILFDSVLKQSCFNTTSCNYNLNVKKISSGTHTITANAKDAAGNTGTNSISVTSRP